MDSSKLNISTCVYIARMDTKFDLENIFEYIVLNESILGIKYHNNYRGNIKHTGSFFNQATLKIFIKKYNKETSLKVFSNGLFQITGVKNDSQALQSVKIFLENITSISGSHVKPVIIEDGIIFDKKDYDLVDGKIFDRFNYIKIYDNTGKVIGRKKKTEYIIKDNKVVLCKENNWFVDVSHKKFCKNIYSPRGEYIGYYEYSMKYKRKNLILHGCSYTKKDENTDFIVNKYNTVIGERISFIEKNITAPQSINDNFINVAFSSVENQEIFKDIKNKKYFNDFSTKISLKVSNINCNFEIFLNKKLLNKINVHNIFTKKYLVSSYYKPDSKYQAINLKLYYDKDLNLLDFKQEYYYKFTVLIFQNGKIIISGCVNRLQIVTVKKFIVSVFEECYDDLIISNTMTLDKVVTKDEFLSIWDI